MAIVGDFFVTPHAVRQFQSRIRAVSYETALGLIICELRDHRKSVKPTNNGIGLMVRTRGEHAMRAVIVPKLGSSPVVVTILRGAR